MDAQKLDLEDRDRGQGSLVSKGQSLHGARNHISPCLGNLEVLWISKIKRIKCLIRNTNRTRRQVYAARSRSA